MDKNEPILKWIQGMTAPSEVMRNYIVPGLSSTMLSRGEDGSKVRMFEMSREQELFVAPHSHRYNFACNVLTGIVENTVLRESDDDKGDLFQEVRQTYLDSPGKYESSVESIPVRYVRDKYVYRKGDWYGMSHGEIHSIWFSKGARVLFLEGPDLKDSSVVLQPYSDRPCDISFTADWMFV